MEDGTLDSATVEASASFESGYIISEATSTDSDRPLEGDLIYHPILNKLFQINFVDHDEPYFQLDNNPVFKLKCRLFEYSQEFLDTGVTAIDEIEDALSLDSGAFQFTLEQETATINALLTEDDDRVRYEISSDELIALEDSDMTTSTGSLLAEDGDYLIQETYIVGDGASSTTNLDTSAQNELFEVADNSVLDFSESNPFGDVGRSN